MKGKSWVKLGFFLIPFGFYSIFLFILFDYLWDFILYGEIAIITLIASEILGLFSIFYGRREAKQDFSHRLQEVMQEKGTVTPSDLEQIEREVFGSVITFGSVRFGYGGAHDVVLTYDNDLLKKLWVTARVEEVMETENLK